MDKEKLKPYEVIVEHFKEFFQKNGNDSWKMINSFYEKERKIFEKHKINELTAQGETYEEAVIKTRQSWVSIIGKSLEKIFEILIIDFCHKNNLKITNENAIKSLKLKNIELELVYRSLIVKYGDYSVLPDSDIIIYKMIGEMPKILAILSIKNSFRERYTETPYWKLKLLQSNFTKHIKVFMITPDKDNEISFKNNIHKSRIVLEYELDGIYIAKLDFDASKKIKGIETLLQDLEKLL